MKNLKSNSIWFKVFLACFASYAVYTLVTLGMAITDKENAVQQLQTQIEQQQIENAELEDMVKNGVNEDYIEKIAREKLELVYPNERIFVGQDG